MNKISSYLFILFILIFSFLSGCQQKQSPESSGNPNQTDIDESFKQEIMGKPVNFLVLGIDSRGEEHSRADSILVVQYTAEDRVVKVVSIMRDSFVKIPGYEHDYGKINMAHYLGGEELLKQTIKENFDIDIDHTVTIDFEGFVAVIDALVPEGITVEVNQKMIDDMNLKVEPGKNTLHGEELLKYARFRHDALSDFGRVGRHQEILLEVMNAMNEKINSLVGIAKIPLVVDDALKNVETDLTVPQILTLSSCVFLQPIEKIDTMRIPVYKGFNNKNDQHAGAVLEINFPKNIEVLHKFLSEPTPVND